MNNDYLFVTSCKLADFCKNPDDESYEDYAYLLILNLAPELESRMCENFYVCFRYFLNDFHKDHILDHGEISFDDYLIEFSNQEDETIYQGNGAINTWLHSLNIVRKLVKFYLSNKE